MSFLTYLETFSYVLTGAADCVNLLLISLKQIRKDASFSLFLYNILNVEMHVKSYY